MTKHLYAFGDDSPLVFEITDNLAKKYNSAKAKYIKAHVRLNQKVGRPWDPEKDPIKVGWTRGETRAWNKFQQIFRDTVQVYGPYHPNDLMTDYLVMHASEVLVSSLAGHRLVGRVVSASVFYEFFVRPFLRR